MKGLLLWGSLAIAAGACYLICKSIDEIFDDDSESYSTNAASSNQKNDYISYSAIVTKEWIMNKVRDCFDKTSAKKATIFDLKYNDTFKGKGYKLFSKYAKDGFDYAIVLMDSNNNIIEIDVVKNLYENDIEVDQLLGDEHMLVITA